MVEASGKLRVLHLVNRWNPTGGVERFVDSLVKETSDQNDYTIASLITEVETPTNCRKIERLLPNGQIEAMFINGKRLTRVLEQGHYDVVHIHASNGSAFYLAHLAKKAGVPRRIVHSHNTQWDKHLKTLKLCVDRLMKFLYMGSATDRWACASGAGKFLFSDEPFQVFLNSVDSDKFRFSPQSRERIRGQLRIGDRALLLGSMGRITSQKNPLFQLRVFAELRNIIPGSFFCMVGSGEMEGDVIRLADELGISEDIIRVEATSDPAAFFSAFDVLIIPSLYEGLPFTGIEAQCSGLRILASDVMPKELAITDCISFESLGSTPRVWAEKIVQMAKRESCERVQYAERVMNAGYDSRKCNARIAEAYRHFGEQR